MDQRGKAEPSYLSPGSFLGEIVYYLIGKQIPGFKLDKSLTIPSSSPRLGTILTYISVSHMQVCLDTPSSCHAHTSLLSSSLSPLASICPKRVALSLRQCGMPAGLSLSVTDLELDIMVEVKQGFC